MPWRKVINLFLVVEGLQRREVDALENGFQGFFFVALLFLDVDDLRDALFEGGFAMGVRVEFHDGSVLCCKFNYFLRITQKCLLLSFH